MAEDTPVSLIQTPSGEANDVGCGRLFNEGSVLQALVERIQLAGSAAEAEEAISCVTEELTHLQDKAGKWKKEEEEEEGAVRDERKNVIATASTVAEAAERVRRRTGGKDTIDVEEWRQRAQVRASNCESGEVSAIRESLNECLATIESEEQELASILDEIKKSIKEAGDDLELTQEISGRGARTQKAIVERLRTAMDVALESVDREGELFIGNVPREHDEGAPATKKRLEETEEADRLARDEKADVGQTPSTLTEEPGVSRVQLTAENHVQGQGEVRQETVPTTLTGIPTTEKTARGAANEPSTSDTRRLLLTVMARGDVGCAFQLQRARLDLHPELGETADLDPRILWAHALIWSQEWGVGAAELSRTVDEAALSFPQEKHQEDDIRRMQALFAGLAAIGSALTTGSTTAAALFQQAKGLASEGLPEIHKILHTLTENQSG